MPNQPCCIPDRVFVVLFVLQFACVVIGLTESRSFTIGKNCFLKDGQPFRYVSGTMHYWRVPEQYWEDSFVKMRAAGLTAVDTYLIWNLHEQEPGDFYFGGNLNFTRYFQLAQKNGLLVVLRPGPFIAAEVDLGGLPYWLVRKNPDMKLRTTDPSYLHYVERWYNVSLPLVKPYLYANGGPIITVQVENEYSAYGCDVTYLEYLRDMFRRLLGNDVILFTNNYAVPQYLKCGTCPDTLATGDFGTNSISGGNISFYLDSLRMFNPDGPLVDTEFYSGWLDVWGSPHSTLSTSEMLDAAQIFMDRNVSFNFYTFHGGTNFGFVAASSQGPFQPITTSYDFNAPLSEAGDPTEKYYQIRDFLGRYFPLPPGPVPQPSKKGAYGSVQLRFAGSVYDNLKSLCPGGPIYSTLPMTFEILKHGHGFVLYRSYISQTFRDPTVLSIPGLHDRAIVLIDQVPVGIIGQGVGVLKMGIFVQPGQALDLLVQNEGRGGFFSGGDVKGIIGNVSLDGNNLTQWAMYPLSLPNFPARAPQTIKLKRNTPFGSKHHELRLPGFFSASFSTPEVLDTFVQLDGWTNGYIFVNGHNLGRYWPVQGPQVTLYVPAVYLNSGKPNVVDVFELENAPCAKLSECLIRFVDTPILNATVPVGLTEGRILKHSYPPKVQRPLS
ncbi:Beta-galactosidase [Hypsibius exemplaris]|uniref:Beta-galactosidase n=1 Tax=Hypsibius exemplaris TaxID=2072580 RepID=A0A9X6RMW9_HYPEX|nr:Beta-galactosidase [Hypsibius exemplaris]